MSDELERLRREIAALKQQLAANSVDNMLGTNNTIADSDVHVENVVAGNLDQSKHGTVNMNDGRVDLVVGMNLGKIIYGRDPDHDELELIQIYLRQLAEKFSYLPTSNLANRLDRNQGISMPAVYVMLGTHNNHEFRSGVAHQLTQWYDEKKVKEAYDPELVLPDQALYVQLFSGEYDDIVSLQRQELVTQAIWKHQHMVLLGVPGGGKSTVLRHLTWVLAQRGLDQTSDMTELAGWNADERLLPLFLPLRELSGAIKQHGASSQTVLRALSERLREDYALDDDGLLKTALIQRHKTMLIFDGLDEVPAKATDTSADRTTTINVIREFLRTHSGNRCVISCRTRAFDSDLQKLLGWHVAEIAPLTGGQIRHFAKIWYDELVSKGQIERRRADEQHEALVSAITADNGQRLRRMADVPLLLTMMSLVLLEQGTLPRDRATLYEAIMVQLLGAWDKHKVGGQNLSDVIGDQRISSDNLRPLLDRLSFEAHRAASSDDGRGRIAKTVLRDALCQYFESAGVDNEWQRAMRCIDYFDQRSGLMQPEDDGETYAFAHLTLQEYCAGRHLVRDKAWRTLTKDTRAADPERWREPLLLGIGHLHASNTSPEKIEIILSDLCKREGKSDAQWYRDAIFAAEIGQERDWQMLQSVGVDTQNMRETISKPLAHLFERREPPLPAKERVQAGFAYGNICFGSLGDLLVPEPKFHVIDKRIPFAYIGTKHQHEDWWQPAVDQYWCKCEAGTFWFGAGSRYKLQQVTLDYDFYIARYPVTNAEYARFIFKNTEIDYEPEFWNEDDYFHPLQPVVGVSWYSAMKYCQWLRRELNIDVRLPTSLENERAARHNNRRTFPWGNVITPEHANFSETQIGRPSPLGCFPLGNAVCGASDMKGNVREWLATKNNNPHDPEPVYNHCC